MHDVTSAAAIADINYDEISTEIESAMDVKRTHWAAAQSANLSAIAAAQQAKNAAQAASLYAAVFSPKARTNFIVASQVSLGSKSVAQRRSGAQVAHLNDTSNNSETIEVNYTNHKSHKP